jgi:hypothetical protein
MSEAEGDKRDVHIGYFTDETDAGLAYNKSALKHFGAFARLNDVNWLFAD